jgi:RNA polymerase sigma factor (sigma-70 family)
VASTTHAERRWRALVPHREKAIAVVRPLVDGYVDAEDVVHDAMVRVAQWQALDVDKARGLLCHAARQVALDRFRNLTVAQRAFVRLRGFERTRESVSPEEVVIRRDDLRQALATLAAILSEREREVTLLRLSGLSPGETADRLGLSLKSVESAYNRARERVRQAGP